MIIKLNLLPDYKKEAIKKNKQLKFILKEGLMLSFIAIFIFGGFFSFNYILGVSQEMVSNHTQKSSKKEAYEKVKKIEADFVQMNKNINQVKKIQEGQMYWSQVLLKINENTPSDVAISSLSTKDYEVLILGISSNREELLKFKDNLEKEACFSEVVLPLSDLVSKSDIDFQMSFNLKKECLNINL